MPTITVKISDALNRKARAAATKRGENLSALARRALEREIAGGPDFAALAAKHKGMMRGPADLSSREGYGR